MVVDEYRTGQTYYRCENSGQIAVVESWIYRGYIRQACNSSSCDVPYFFYQFELRGSDRERPTIVNFPNKVQLQESMLNWEDFALVVAKIQAEIDDISAMLADPES
jgi:hypothetical protein